MRAMLCLSACFALAACGEGVDDTPEFATEIDLNKAYGELSAEERSELCVDLLPLSKSVVSDRADCEAGAALLTTNAEDCATVREACISRIKPVDPAAECPVDDFTQQLACDVPAQVLVDCTRAVAARDRRIKAHITCDQAAFLDIGDMDNIEAYVDDRGFDATIESCDLFFDECKVVRD